MSVLAARPVFQMNSVIQIHEAVLALVGPLPSISVIEIDCWKYLSHVEVPG